MVDRWNVLIIVLAFMLCIDGCLSVNLEGLALLKFRERVESDPNGVFSNWNCGDSDPCSWSGVHCLDGVVQMLDLKELSLRGTLAPELGQLTNLRSLVLYKNHLHGVIPKEISGLTKLELLDLRSNNLSGIIPAEIGELQSLKQLLICGNKFDGGISSAKLRMFTELQYDQNLVSNVATGIDCINRKLGGCIWQSSLKQLNKASSLVVPLKEKLLKYLTLPSFRLRNVSSLRDGEKCCDNHENSMEPHIAQNVEVIQNSIHHRWLLESSNLFAAPISSAPPEEITDIPSFGSGSFPAIPNSPSGNGKKKPSPAPVSSPDADTPLHPSPTIPSSQSFPANTAPAMTSSNGWGNWKYFLLLPAGVIALAIIAALLFICRSRGAATIGPWKTGLSGQLQKAFVAGVPKLNRSELETACEDFSNIIVSNPHCTVFKGTLSSGVEIAVASTIVTSAKDWSKNSEMHFRKKVDSLSRVNHKNFVNLIGYCEEDSPFTRMMVFEYASSSLYEHLQVKGLEHLDWPARMRIIMGVAYCLQYMNHDLNPPMPHPHLTSRDVFLTDDYAAKIVECGFWKDLALKGGASGDEDKNPSKLQLANLESNVYNFGILLLETISGKPADSEEEGSLVNWAMEYLSDRRTINHLTDPSLQSVKSNELDVICEVILQCVHEDPMQRPTMKEVTAKLKEVIGISPEQACPRLSPLWWAELEILSVEAS